MVYLLGGARSRTGTSTRLVQLHIRGKNCVTLPPSIDLKYAMRFADGRAFYSDSHVLLFGVQNSGRPTVVAMDRETKHIEYTEQPAFNWPSPEDLPKQKGGGKSSMFGF